MQISVINTEDKEKKWQKKYQMRSLRQKRQTMEREKKRADSMVRRNKLCCLCDPLLVRYAPTLFSVQSKTALDDFDVFSAVPLATGARCVAKTSIVHDF